MQHAWFALACALPLVASAASLAQDSAPKHELRWKIASGAVIETSLKDLREDQNSMELSFGNQDPQPSEHSSEDRFELVWRDVVKAAKDGRPTAVKRKFSKLEHEIAFGEDHEQEFETPLGDQEIGIDESGEEPELELPEDLELELKIQKALRIEAELGAFLPSEAVEIGGTWALDAKKLNALLNHGRGLFERGEGVFHAEGGGEMRVAAEDLPESHPKVEPPAWEGSCKLLAVEELEGRQVARVELKGKSTPPKSEDEGGLKISQEGGGVGIMISAGPGSQEQELKGEMVFDLAGGYVRSVVLEIEGESETDAEHEAEFGTIKLHSTSHSTRKVELSVAVAAPKQ
ncbi:MAG: hypothetical protein IPN34_12480 [Planctomycetes bacterium]|nr:hypothetical protein [Planctomycetota bacterium]